MKNAIIKEFLAHQETIKKVIETMQEPLLEASKLAVETLRAGNKILLCGNGGSAADAQHIAAELTGRYKTERRGLPGIALTTDTSALTAIGNDYGYDRVFDRQVEALANKGDLLIGISTSGNSKNVINALKVAREMGVVGALRGPSAWTQKTPPEQMMYADAKAECAALAQRKLTDSVRSKNQA